MATYSGSFPFTGKFGDIVAYKMQGSNKTIIRAKSGIDKKRIARDPAFALTRMNNSEWTAAIKAGKAVNLAIADIKRLADHNYVPSLNGLMRRLMHEDTINPLAKRSVLFSKAVNYLEGFSVNRYNNFDSILRQPLAFEADRDAGTATLHMPELIPGINLYNPKAERFYRFVCSLGVVADIVYHEQYKQYMPMVESMHYQGEAQSPWTFFEEDTPATTFNLALANWTNPPGTSIILSAGIEFGKPGAGGMINSVKYAGAGKILKVI